MQDFFDRVSRGLGLHEALPDGSCVTFVLAGDDGGIWTVTRDGDRSTVDTGESEVADCRLQCSVDDFRSLLDGALDPRAGFLDGRLRVSGDVGLVLSLQRQLARRTTGA